MNLSMNVFVCQLG